MSEELLNIAKELSEKPTTKLTLQLMKLTADNIIKDKEIDRLNNIINELEKIRKEAIEYINEDIKGNYFRRYEDEVYKMCSDLLNILNKGDNKE